MSRRLRPKETVLFDVEMSAPKRNSPVWCRDVCAQKKQSCLMSRPLHPKETVLLDVETSAPRRNSPVWCRDVCTQKKQSCLMSRYMHPKETVLFDVETSAPKRNRPVWCRDVCTQKKQSCLMSRRLHPNETVLFDVEESARKRVSIFRCQPSLRKKKYVLFDDGASARQKVCPVQWRGFCTQESPPCLMSDVYARESVLFNAGVFVWKKVLVFFCAWVCKRQPMSCICRCAEHEELISVCRVITQMNT